MDNLIADLHIHSWYSHDSLMSPRKIVKCAKAAGLDCIAVTDHGTIRGGVDAKKFAEDLSIEVIVGTEIRTDSGDIMGLQLVEEIRSTAWEDVIREIRDQGGIIVFPHPYRDHTNIEKIAGSVDFIECWNARNTPEQNHLASDLARRYARPVIVGSDAHIASEIGSVRGSIDRFTFRCMNVINRRYATEREIQISRAISLVRHGHLGELIFCGFRKARKRLLL